MLGLTMLSDQYSELNDKNVIILKALNTKCDYFCYDENPLFTIQFSGMRIKKAWEGNWMISIRLNRKGENDPAEL